MVSGPECPVRERSLPFAWLQSSCHSREAGRRLATSAGSAEDQGGEVQCDAPDRVGLASGEDSRFVRRFSGASFFATAYIPSMFPSIPGRLAVIDSVAPVVAPERDQARRRRSSSWH